MTAEDEPRANSQAEITGIVDSLQELARILESENFGVDEPFREPSPDIENLAMPNGSLTPEAIKRKSEAQIKRLEDPEQRWKISEAKQKKQDDISPPSTSDYEVAPYDQELWDYVLSHDLKNAIVAENYLTDQQMRILDNYFSGRGSETRARRLLNRFSIAVANLA